MKEQRIFIEGRRNGYGPEQCGHSMTVGELIEYLQGFDEEARVFLKNDGGYTFGSIDHNSFEWTERAERHDVDAWDDEVPGVSEREYIKMVIEKYGESAVPVYNAVMAAMEEMGFPEYIIRALDEYDERMFLGDIEAFAEAADDLYDLTGDERYKLDCIPTE